MINIQGITSLLEQQRQEFPSLSNKVYFNFGGQGTLPRSALEAIIDAHEFLQQKGPFSLRVNSWLEQKKALLRQELAQEFSVFPQTISLTENVTVGCNIVLWGIDWQKGDRILITDCEHPGIIAIVKEVARRFGVEIAICPILNTLNQGNPTTVIQDHLTPTTRLVILSHLLWNTGQVLPLDEIVSVCHHFAYSDNPVRVLVDAAQSAGSLSLDLTASDVDFYAFTGHKWFCGPVGVGGLYIRPESFDYLHPTFIGWRGIDVNGNGQPMAWKNDGRKFEVSSSAYPQYEGLRAALMVHQNWGVVEKRYEQICRLSAYLWQGLSEIEGIKCLKDSAPEAGLVSFQVTRNLTHKQLVQELEEKGFLLRTLHYPDCIRACIHYFTLPAEIEQLVEAIDSIVG
ncbi:MAG: aminotransferase class V-fold PLP-dependent enzyme [cyanobacterium endosymbiont of Rhopalodia sterrenbergii]